jgi:hypothetical protein
MAELIPYSAAAGPVLVDPSTGDVFRGSRKLGRVVEQSGDIAKVEWTRGGFGLLELVGKTNA